MSFLSGLATGARGLEQSLLKAQPRAPLVTTLSQERATTGPQAMFWDPFSVLNNLGYKDKQSAITFSTLDAIFRRCPLITDVIIKRLAQLSNFYSRPRDRFDTGLRIGLTDPTARMTPADRKRAAQLEEWILKCGTGDRNRPRFAAMSQMIMRDSLRYDQLTIEKVRNRRGEITELWPVDAKSIRLADTRGAFYTDAGERRPHTVQIYQEMVTREWRREDMIFGVRNKHTDIELQGYGVAEAEWMIAAITGFLYGFDYNSRFFQQGTTAKGLLHLKGQMSEPQLQAFQRFWYTMLSGVENAWRTPVINTDEVNWVDMQKDNKDMEFSAWMDFLIKLICGAYLIDPMEVHFKYGTEGSSGSMFESAGKEKLQSSKDSGLKPLLDFYAELLNTEVIEELEPGFRLEFVGLEAQTRDQAAKEGQILVQTNTTIDELRQLDGKDPLGEEKGGNLILNAAYIQWLTTQQQLEAQASAQAQGLEEPGAPGDDGSDTPDNVVPIKGAKADDGAGEDDDPFAGLLQLAKAQTRPKGRGLVEHAEQVLVDLMVGV